ncbi:MAG: hypothetical protein DMG05_17230 [Acidobacteria bacterium]|nr:MAG: hypothetical protein DMG05_17230 [Acidobacteriota bacterium]
MQSGVLSTGVDRSHPTRRLGHASLTLHRISLDFIRFLGSLPGSALAAENLVLRKQLTLYQGRQVRPRRATDATRLTMVLAARLFDWKGALISVRPETFTGWHRKGFKMLWRWKSRPISRPRIPKNLRQLILTMARTIRAGGKPASRPSSS